MEEVSINGLYQHFKGGIYKVIAIAKHSETLEEMVVYQSQKDNSIWVRPKSMWNEQVLYQDKLVNRFSKID